MQRGLILTAGTTRGNLRPGAARRARRVRHGLQRRVLQPARLRRARRDRRHDERIAHRHRHRQRLHPLAARARHRGDGSRRAVRRPHGARPRQRHAPHERRLVGHAVREAGDADARDDRPAARRLRRRQRLRLPLQGPVLGSQDPGVHAPGRAPRPADLDRGGQRADDPHRRRRRRRAGRPSDRDAPLASRGDPAGAARRRGRRRPPERRLPARAVRDDLAAPGSRQRHPGREAADRLLLHGEGLPHDPRASTACPRSPPRAATRSPTFDIAAMAAAIPDALVDEIAIACTPDEARDRLAQWRDLVRRGPVLCADRRRAAGAGAENNRARFSTCSGSVRS